MRHIQVEGIEQHSRSFGLAGAVHEQVEDSRTSSSAEYRQITPPRLD